MFINPSDRDEKGYQVPFRFTGKLNKLTVSLKPESLSVEDQKRFDEESDASRRRPSD